MNESSLEGKNQMNQNTLTRKYLKSSRKQSKDLYHDAFDTPPTMGEGVLFFD
jgi:hypothetical protein